ncbi:MAG: hypothetical protein RBT65_00205 [Methanolobus sp.]|nr:hypothetical protein [Methanolobus sp.]
MEEFDNAKNIIELKKPWIISASFFHEDVLAYSFLLLGTWQEVSNI